MNFKGQGSLNELNDFWFLFFLQTEMQQQNSSAGTFSGKA